MNIGAKLKKWQDYGWIVALLVLAYLAFRIIPAIDPRSGIDGWGDLFASIVAALKVVMCTIGAWLCKNLYWWEPGGVEEERWHAAIEGTAIEADPEVPYIGARAALTLVIKDRIEWAFWLVVWLWALFVA